MHHPKVYHLQNAAIHQARMQLEANGLFSAGAGLDGIRDLAAGINNGVRSISSLSLEQRRTLIELLQEKGASVKNPGIYESDLKAEAEQSGKKRKVIRISALSEKTQRLIDTLAAQVSWPESDSFDKLCVNLFTTTRPRNAKEARQAVAILRSMIERQNKKAGIDIQEKPKRKRRRKEVKPKIYPSYSYKQTDSRGRERSFIFSVITEIGGLYHVRAKEIRAAGDKGGYQFTASSPDLDDAFASLAVKIKEGLSKVYLSKRDGNLFFDHVVRGRVDYGGICIDGEFIPVDEFFKALQIHEGWTFTLTIDEDD